MGRDDGSGQGLGIDLAGQVLQDLRQAEDLARGAQEKSGFLSGLGHAKDAQQPGRHIKTGPARVAFKKNDVVLFQFDALGTAQECSLPSSMPSKKSPFSRCQKLRMPPPVHQAREEAFPVCRTDAGTGAPQPDIAAHRQRVPGPGLSRVVF